MSSQAPAAALAAPRALRQALHEAGYVADEALATSCWLARELQRPLLLEGDAGVGKTALASALALVHDAELVRLQCFEGLDLSQAAYEWNYGRQLMAIRLHEASGQAAREQDLFGREYLLERPLLRAISTARPCVLLIDEIDRADEAFEAFLLEMLAEYQITVPEIGTLRASTIPQVILTSNGTRELSDALRRRCLYHYLDYPELAREIAIVRLSLPQVESRLVEHAVAFVQALRREDLAKTPGVAETLDWVRALHGLGQRELPEQVELLLATLGCLLKTQEDRFTMQGERIARLIERRSDAGVAAGMR